MHGVGIFDIQKIRITQNISSNNHYDDTFAVYFIDSADFQDGNTGPSDARYPQQSVNPTTGAYISGDQNLYNY